MGVPICTQITQILSRHQFLSAPLRLCGEKIFSDLRVLCVFAVNSGLPADPTPGAGTGSS